MKKIYLLSIIMFFVSFISSQELEQKYVSSLPENIQKDILKNIDEQKDDEKPLYRSITSQTKIEKKSLEDLKNRIEEDLKLLKDMIDEDNKPHQDDELILFGSDFFKTYQSSFMPINEPNLNSTYILDFGDVLEIQLIGQNDSIDKYALKRDGSINLPQVGVVKLSGLSLKEATSLIKAKIEASFIGTQAFVSLVSLRDINILISGNAFNPGIYTVGGNSNMLHALSVAGGISDYGSYRKIDLIRDGEIIDNLDLYNILITGKFNSKVNLRSGDVIFVNPAKKIITIDGAVKIPAKYELHDDESLGKVIKYANGITKDADLKNIFLDRILDGKVKSLPISNIRQFENISANDGDKIFIRKHSFRKIKVSGAVLKPGTYTLTEGESLKNLIDKAGGYTKNAYPFGAIYENKKALYVNKMAQERLYEELINNIITVSQKNPTGNFDLTAMLKLIENLKESEPNGRVVVDLLDEMKTASFNIRDGDRLTIPEKPAHVYVYGEVSNAGALSYEPTKLLKYYIDESGGLNENAANELIYVLHPDGSTQRANIRKNLFQNNPNKQIELYPGSVIFVPRQIENTASNRLAAQAYASILGSIGISLASLSSISNDRN